jgi:hypothetical protein
MKAAGTEDSPVWPGQVDISSKGFDPDLKCRYMKRTVIAVQRVMDFPARRDL